MLRQIIKLIFLLLGIFISQLTFGQKNATPNAKDSILYVVDGYLIFTKSLKNNILDLITPDDIESITIYKDQDSLKIFGDKMSEGKSQAIVITTKNPLKYKKILRDNAQEDIELDSVVYEQETSPFFYLNRGVEKDNKGNYKGAIADYDSAIILNLKNANVFINRGLAKEKLRDFMGARRDYEKAIQIEPENSKAYNCMATFYFKQNQFKEAVAFYTKAIAIEPEDGIAYYNRGIAYYNLKMLNECCKDLKKASELEIEIALRARNTYCK
ncbi:MAG: tetratricopeptide repeat protein [Thermoflexibacter sp.]|jgi:tetratricopeptide (TPR) repeat protein|nr:tetratricopeptide repeat protein [Thermoflexibacter sp.]